MDSTTSEKEVLNYHSNLLSMPVDPTASVHSKSPKKSLQFLFDLCEYISSPPATPCRICDSENGSRRTSVDSIDFFGPGLLPVADEHVAIIKTSSSEDDSGHSSQVCEKHSTPTSPAGTDKVFLEFAEIPASTFVLPVSDESPTDRGRPPAVQLARHMSRQISRQISKRSTTTLSQQRGMRRALGPFLALAAAFSISVSSVASKFLLDSFTTPQIGVFRFASLCLITTPFMLRERVNPFSSHLLRQFGWLLLLRMAFGSSSFLCRIFAFSKLPMGDATTIMFMSPIFVGIFARIFLREKFRKIFFFSALAAICGCVLISRPPFLGFPMSVQRHVSSGDRLIGLLASTGSAVSSAMVIVLLRLLRKAPAQVIIFYFGLGGTVISVFLCYGTSTPIAMPTTIMHWVWIAVLALASNLGQWLFTISVHYENANVISLFRASDVLWAFLAQIVVFGNMPHWLSICGAFLVCSGVALLTISKILESFRKNDEKFIRIF